MSTNRILESNLGRSIAIAFALPCAAATSVPPNDSTEAGAEPNADVAEATRKVQLVESNSAKSPPDQSREGLTNALQLEPSERLETHNNFHSSEWWLVYLTAALAITTFFLALYTGKLYRATVALGREAKATSDRQEKEMERSLAVAEKSADTSRRTVETMETTAERQLRAYIFATHDGPMTFDSNQLTARIVLKNYGQTPASEVQCHVFMALQKLPLVVQLDPPDYEGGSKSPLAPGESVSIYPTLPAQLTQTEIDSIREHESAIFVWGEVAYVDVFKQNRNTRFRFLSDGDAFDKRALAYDHEGNEAE